MAGLTLSLDAVTRRFEGAAQAAVDQVSLAIEPGTFLALLGPSGCGKTTLLRMIAGFENPDAGTIRLGDRVLAGASAPLPPEARNMAMVFQSYALWPHMTVAENVGYPLKVRGVSRAERDRRVARALRAVHLEAFAARRPAALSGGQRQRVALARCLVAEPAVILLDEPLANLDRHLRAAMEEEFRAFHARTGATMIYVTHDQAEAMALADQVAVMTGGRILQAAAPEAIYRCPADERVAALIGQGTIVALPLGPGGDREIGQEVLLRALAAPDSPCGVPVLIRPEDVAVGSAEGGGLAVKVEACVYKGERFALECRDAAGRRLVAFAQVRAAPGTEIGLTPRRGWRLAET